MDHLPEHYRTVFVLRDVEGWSAADAADCLGLTAETVRTRLHRARSALRAELVARVGVATAQLFPLHLTRCDRVVESVLRLVSRGPYTASTQPAF